MASVTKSWNKRSRRFTVTLLLSLLNAPIQSFAFITPHRPAMTPRSLLLSAFPPSKVSDEYDSPTPDVPSDEIPIVDPATIPELHYDPKVHAPGQPWRRGDTDGCHDPIHARWRREGEELIRAAASSVGAVVHDVTWCMAQCIVTLRDTSEVDGGLEGPEVKYDDGSDYDERGTGQPYFWEPTMDDDEYEEMQKTHPNVEYEVLDDWTNDPRGEVDTTVIRTIGKAIIDILQEPAIEDRLEILSRHELMLAKEPTDPNFLITQKQFDKNRGEMVAVETRDPWKSNRTIKGKLVGRNALDVILNVEGSEVTLPQNFIYRVKLE